MPESAKKRLEWSRLAQRDLFAAWKFIVQDSPQAANQVASALFNAADLILEQPFIGRRGGVKNTRELVVANTSFVIVYRVARGAVRIGRVLHSSRKYP